MKFLADMGVSPRAVEWLRAKGIDAKHLREEGLQRLPDTDVLAKAREESRILLTMDLDFGYLMALSRERLPSVVLFRLSDERPAVLQVRLAEVLSTCTDSLASGAFVTVTDTLIRVRSLPIA